jgi:hypothetical protein
MHANQLLIELFKQPKPTPFLARMHFDILSNAAEFCRRAISATQSPSDNAEAVALLDAIEHALAYYTMEMILADEPDFGTRLLNRRALNLRTPSQPGSNGHG